MSGYECQEPGCNFSIFAAGPILTDTDWGTQDDYEQSIEDHEAQHYEEKERAISEFDSNIGDRIRGLRATSGLRQGDLAEKTGILGVHIPLISLGRIERGERPIRLVEALSIARALELGSVAELLPETFHLGSPPESSHPNIREEIDELWRRVECLEQAQKKMPSAVRAAEGDEKPTNQEGVFNDNFSPLPHGGDRSGVEAGSGEASPGRSPAPGDSPAPGLHLGRGGRIPRGEAGDDRQALPAQGIPQRL